MLKHGYHLDPKNVDVLKLFKYTPPKTAGEARKLLVTLGYFADFSRLAKPLFDLFKNNQSAGKPSKCGKNMKGRGT